MMCVKLLNLKLKSLWLSAFQLSAASADHEHTQGLIARFALQVKELGKFGDVCLAH